MKQSLIFGTLCVFLTSFFVATSLPMKAVANSTWVVECRKHARCETKSDGAPLFDEKNFIPGQYAEEEIIVRNRSKDSCLLSLAVQPKDTTNQQFVEQFVTSFFDINHLLIELENQVYELPLSELWSGKQVRLGVVASHSTSLFTWRIMLNSLASNEFQAESLSFDADLIFECDSQFEEYLSHSNIGGRLLVLKSEPTPTPTCSEKPLLDSIKLNLVSQKRDEGKVTLSWNKIADATYKLKFVALSQQKTFGFSGIKDEQKTIFQLQPDEDYLFSVRAERGCALSAESNQIISRGLTHHDRTSIFHFVNSDQPTAKEKELVKSKISPPATGELEGLFDQTEGTSGSVSGQVLGVSQTKPVVTQNNKNLKVISLLINLFEKLWKYFSFIYQNLSKKITIQ